MDFSEITHLLDQLPSLGIPGIDLIVYHKGQQVYRHMTGTCDYLRQKPVSEDTLYWIYSMTKPITMTAVMQCVEKGIIGLEDHVSDYIPEFHNMKVRDPDGTVRAATAPVRVKHLMSMTAGLSYDRRMPALLEAMRDPHATTATLVAAMATEPLLYDPGTQYKYSFGHDVAARVLEVATGKTFGEYLKENIFEPLGMKDTTFRAEAPELRARLAAQFKYDKETHTCTPDVFGNEYILSENYESGGAGLITTTADYGKFVSAMSVAFSAEHPVLGHAALDLMRTPQLSDEVAGKYFSQIKWNMGYSYGLGVRTMKYPEKSGAKSPVGEFAWDGAAGSHGLIDPDNEIALVFMIQVKGCSYSYEVVYPKIRDMVYEILLGK